MNREICKSESSFVSSEALYDASARFVKKAEGSEDKLFADENEKHSVVVILL